MLRPPRDRLLGADTTRTRGPRARDRATGRRPGRPAGPGERARSPGVPWHRMRGHIHGMPAGRGWLTPRQSSPPFPLSVPERGDIVSSPSPEGRGGQGVRTAAGADVVPFDLILAPDERTIL